MKGNSAKGGELNRPNSSGQERTYSEIISEEPIVAKV